MFNIVKPSLRLPYDDFYSNLGRIVDILTFTYPGMEISEIVVDKMLRHIIGFKQFRFIIDCEGNEVGFYSWVEVSEETEKKYCQSRTLDHYSEFNEGNCVWIHDVHFHSVDFKTVYRIIKSDVFSRTDKVKIKVILAGNGGNNFCTREYLN